MENCLLALGMESSEPKFGACLAFKHHSAPAFHLVKHSNFSPRPLIFNHHIKAVRSQTLIPIQRWFGELYGHPHAGSASR